MSKKITSIENQIEYLKAIKTAGLVLGVMIATTVVTVGFLTIIDWFV
jgi:hypothetical protein|tara:strand:- start:948 stop:1088 length:141 start_codon:yes stop_codon:yes gene_type:complete